MNCIKACIYISILIFGLAGCQNERSFEWTEEIETLTGGNLTQWLEKAPFEGAWDPYSKSDGRIVMTNIDQVFPFLGEFKNKDDELIDYGEKSDIFQKETIIFKDSQWGELFFHSVLLYEPQELFLKSSYFSSGSPIFSGMNAIYETYGAELSETLIYHKNDHYKTAIYWVESNSKRYLFATHQIGKLVLQFAFPCEDSTKCLKKIKEINRALGLNIDEWANATEQDLAVNDNPQSFWKDPYRHIYSKLDVKINNTEFKEQRRSYKDIKEVDHLFKYTNDKGEYTLSFFVEKTPLGREDYEKRHGDNKFLTVKGGGPKVFIVEEKEYQNISSVSVETYFRDNEVLKIKAQYPANDPKGYEQLQDILVNLRISLI